jgi:hypothetical protein
VDPWWNVGFDLSFVFWDLITVGRNQARAVLLCSLHFAGWPLSELFDAKTFRVLGMDLYRRHDDHSFYVSEQASEDLSVYWILCIVGAGLIDVYISTAAIPVFQAQVDPFSIYPAVGRSDAHANDQQIQERPSRHGLFFAFAIPELSLLRVSFRVSSSIPWRHEI